MHPLVRQLELSICRHAKSLGVVASNFGWNSYWDIGCLLEINDYLKAAFDWANVELRHVRDTQNLSGGYEYYLRWGSLLDIKYNNRWMHEFFFLFTSELHNGYNIQLSNDNVWYAVNFHIRERIKDVVDVDRFEFTLKRMSNVLPAAFVFRKHPLNYVELEEATDPMASSPSHSKTIIYLKGDKIVEHFNIG